MLIRGVWEETGFSDTRFVAAMIIPDVLTAVGISAEAVEGTMRREHVVPRILIINECKRMLRNGDTDDTIARLIQANTKIVFVSPAEQVKLDSSHHLNLSRRMPSGWRFGDDIFARLEAAGIEWFPYSRTGLW